jgi:transaldolase/glucose-6-phosphate isomerase
MSDSTPEGPRGVDARLPRAELEANYAAEFRRARDEGWARRLFEKDASLWSADPAVREKIVARLGWLDAPAEFTERIASLEAFGDALRDAGFTSALVAGMGGSSLAPQVLAGMFPDIADYLAVGALDSTDPAAVSATFASLDPARTLTIVATKSGTTTETLAFRAYAWDWVHHALNPEHRGRRDVIGAYFVSITDPGKAYEAVPGVVDFREAFLNPESVGGRYSALTYFGLVPGSLVGIDLDPLLDGARRMLEDAHLDDPAENPALALGLLLGTLARAGHDKLTFVMDPGIAPLGAWIEQLIAESTGKAGVGIVPIVNEPLGAVSAYGHDRAFVRVRLAGSPAAEPSPDGLDADAFVDALAEAGHPVVHIDVDDPIDVGAEFVRWEVATAVAGIVLGVDPFDEPNVSESKENTKRELDRAERGDAPGGLFARPLAHGEGVTVHGDGAPGAPPADLTVDGALRTHLARIRPDAYLALLAFIAPTPERDARLASIRRLLRDRTHRPTTAGYGPRFLHSTGQLHKGGAPIGWFLQLTADHPADVDVPGEHYTFGALIDAQAAGDLQSLESHGLPVLRVHLGEDVDAGLASLERLLDRTLTPEA